MTTDELDCIVYGLIVGYMDRNWTGIASQKRRH